MAVDLFLGTDTGGTGIKFVVSQADGKVVAEGEVATDPASIPASLERLAAAVAGYMPRIRGVGMACAGIVNPTAGTLGRSPNLPGWQDSNLKDLLEGFFPGISLTLANDVNGALYGEFSQGAGRGTESLVMIALGTGVGGGVMLSGDLLLGSHHGAAEIGHMVLDPQGPECVCGTRGCLEAYAGSVGLLKRARKVAQELPAGNTFKAELAEIGSNLSTRALCQLAEAGVPEAVEVFAWAGRHLGQAVGNLINLLDPDKVIIGGGVARAGDFILGPCRESFPGIVLCAEARHTPVVPAKLGSLAAAVGSAHLAIEAVAKGRTG